MKNHQKIILGVSVVGFIMSMIVSYFFGGYNPIIQVESIFALIVFLIGVIIPFLIVVVTAFYGIVGIFQKDFKKFVWAGSISLCLLILLLIFSFPDLLVK